MLENYKLILSEYFPTFEFKIDTLRQTMICTDYGRGLKLELTAEAIENLGFKGIKLAILETVELHTRVY